MLPYRDVVDFLKEKYSLTKKEALVLEEIIVSGPNKETVALKLNIAASTAYLHFKRLYEKLEVENMPHLFHLVIRTHQELASKGQNNFESR